jgi:hypothetical protein
MGVFGSRASIALWVLVSQYLFVDYSNGMGKKVTGIVSLRWGFLIFAMRTPGSRPGLNCAAPPGLVCGSRRFWCSFSIVRMIGTSMRSRCAASRCTSNGHGSPNKSNNRSLTNVRQMRAGAFGSATRARTKVVARREEGFFDCEAARPRRRGRGKKSRLFAQNDDSLLRGDQ